MIVIEGYWKSSSHVNSNGKITVTINSENLLPKMIGTVKIVHNVDENHYCANVVSEFLVEIIYEKNSEMIQNGSSIVTRKLFLRQQNFSCDTYMTLRLTSHGECWYGSYASIYPDDLGELSGLQFIVTYETAKKLNGPDEFDYVDQSKKRKFTDSLI
jgi:hypothetical protein